MMILVLTIQERDGGVHYEMVSPPTLQVVCTPLEAKATRAVCDALVNLPDVTGTGRRTIVKDERDIVVGGQG